jgi:hypothetical protein
VRFWFPSCRSASARRRTSRTAFVGWGDRTVDEMNIGWLDFSYISDEEYAAVQKEKAAHKTTAAQP